MAAAWFAEHLVCPQCHAPLAIADPRCGCGFRGRTGPPPDLRPSDPIAREVLLPADTTAPSDLAQTSISRPAVTYHASKGMRDSSELFSAAEGRLHRGARLLDLGCGPRDQAGAAIHYGMDYVGIDYSSPEADLLADAHALPFADGTFDAVLSYAVFEHLHNPFIAALEVARVVRSGGIFFGTISQGEPYHHSYFHHTPLGTLALLRAAGFRAERLWPSYDTLHALAVMGRYPRVTALLIEVLHRFARATPFLAPRAWLRSSPRERELEELFRAASICFVATRIDAPPRTPAVHSAGS
jgi:SAM-dependent methyltransferase